MKKLVAIIILLLLSCTIGNAQNAASANLRVQLNSIQSIKLNENQDDVTISMSTSSDYINGTSSNQPDHIEIMSSSQYEIKVSAESHLTGSSATIDIGTVTLTPTQGTFGEAPAGTLDFTPTALSLGENTIVQSSHGDAKRTFNIEYHLSGGPAYVNKPPGIYTTVVTYTILMQ